MSLICQLTSEDIKHYFFTQTDRERERGGRQREGGKEGGIEERERDGGKKGERDREGRRETEGQIIEV